MGQRSVFQVLGRSSFGPRGGATFGGGVVAQPLLVAPLLEAMRSGSRGRPASDEGGHPAAIVAYDVASAVERHMQELRAMSAAARAHNRQAKQDDVRRLQALRAWSEQARAEQTFGEFRHDLAPLPWGSSAGQAALRVCDLALSAVEMCKQAIHGMNQHLLPRLRQRWVDTHKRSSTMIALRCLPP